VIWASFSTSNACALSHTEREGCTGYSQIRHVHTHRCQEGRREEKEDAARGGPESEHSIHAAVRTVICANPQRFRVSLTGAKHLDSDGGFQKSLRQLPKPSDRQTRYRMGRDTLDAGYCRQTMAPDFALTVLSVAYDDP
jgi:hypothetical protein